MRDAESNGVGVTPPTILATDLCKFKHARRPAGCLADAAGRVLSRLEVG